MKEETAEQAIIHLTDRFLPLAMDPERLGRLHREMGETCHSIRNRLHSLKLGMYLAEQTEGPQNRGSVSAQQAWSDLSSGYRELESLVDRFHTLIRPLALRPSAIAIAAFFDELRLDWETRLQETGIGVQWRTSDGPASAPGSGSGSGMAWLDPQWMTVGLNGFLEWRLSVLGPGARAVFDWRETSQSIRVVWREALNEKRQAKRTAAIPTGDDAMSGSFSLALLARVVALHQGRLRAEGDDDDGALGFSLSASWPKCWNSEAPVPS